MSKLQKGKMNVMVFSRDLEEQLKLTVMSKACIVPREYEAESFKQEKKKKKSEDGWLQ